VVITDLMMPGMDGMELLGELKKRRPEAMVVMITGFPSVKTAVESVKLGPSTT
jgi:DNA-binding NtrC family response regulator